MNTGDPKIPGATLYYMKTSVQVFLLALLVTAPFSVFAEDTQMSHEYLEKAKVLSASPTIVKTLPGTSISSPHQTLTIEVLEGVDKGAIANFDNDFTQLHAGDLFYVRHTVGGFDPETWAVSDPYRLNVLIGLAGVFVLLLFLFGGVQGVRGLVSLLGSLVLIFYLLLPGIYAGFSPILVSIGVSSLIIIVGSYITHGFNRTTTIAMASMILTIVVVGAATYFVIHAASLSGFTTEENAYLNFATRGKISMVGLLFGGIMIGLLGVLYDIAIGQAIAVEELVSAAAHYTRAQILRRAMRIGREHIGALVNTLAIAYVGAALPLLLLFKQADTSVAYIINSERFATEIIRILMGSSGLVLAVPITTLLATAFLHGRAPRTDAAHSHGH